MRIDIEATIEKLKRIATEDLGPGAEPIHLLLDLLAQIATDLRHIADNTTD